MLWIVDNVPELVEGRPPRIPSWCPALGYVSVLATLRRTGLDHIDAQVDLGGPSAEAAVALLTRPNVDRQCLKEQEWLDLVTWVGGLPLALVILRTSLSDACRTHANGEPSWGRRQDLPCRPS